jgi:tryptophan synthase alpha chain
MVAGAERIAAAFAGSGKSAALMPYLMGGFPTSRAPGGSARRTRTAARTSSSSACPYSDPLADGPVIAAAGARALRNGSTLDGVLGVCETLAPRLPVVLMCYANLIYARGTSASWTPSPPPAGRV